MKQQHHDFVLNRTGTRLLQYINSKDENSREKIYEKVYDLYLLQSSHGKNDFFEDNKKDPLCASNVKDFKKRMNLFTKELDQEKTKPFISISESVRHEFFQSHDLRQNEILQTLAFEARNMSLRCSDCRVCKGRYIKNKFNDMGRLCNHCEEKNKIERETKKANAPTWTDENGKIHFELPTELMNMTIAEKLLIQKFAFLIPCVHLGKGKFGE